MFSDVFYQPFLKTILTHPNRTALTIKGKIFPYGVVAQRIAPIINEIDTTSSGYIALLMEEDILTYSAIIATILSGKVLVPILEEWSQKQRQEVIDSLPCADFSLSESGYLSTRRMYYYFRMTYEDALCRIDNGLINIDNEQVIALQYAFDAQGQLHRQEITAQDFALYLKGCPEKDGCPDLSCIATFFKTPFSQKQYK